MKAVVAGTTVAPRAALDELADTFRARSLADNTMRAYAADWRRFSSWCARMDEQVMPASPATVQRYLADSARRAGADGRAEFRPATMSRWLAGISQAHHLAGHASPSAHPSVRQTMSGIRRALGTEADRAAPLRVDDLHTVLAEIDYKTWPAGVIGRRDAAILAMGYVGGFRRSELSSFVTRDLVLRRDGSLHCRVRRSKTDQQAVGRPVPLLPAELPVNCAVCAAVRWQQLVDAAEEGGRASLMKRLFGQAERDGHCCTRRGPHTAVFGTDTPFLRPVSKHGHIAGRPISGHVVNSVIHRRAGACDLDANMRGHSMRAGFITDAFAVNATAEQIRQQTGHLSDRSLQVYRREFNPLVGNAVTMMKL